MDTTQIPLKEKRRCLEILDRVSNLPPEVIDAILNRIPLRDAVKTSALSRNWRYKWTSISSIVFDARSVPPFIKENRNALEVRRNAELASFVTQVLLHHDGVISRFELYNYLSYGCADVDRWMLPLERKSVREFILVFQGGIRYNVPSSLFLCQHLSFLRLHHCVLKFPSHTKGFNGLTRLHLEKVTFADETIASLVYNNPLLQMMRLMSCDGFSRLNIYAPNLRQFVLGEWSGYISFSYTPKLNRASILGVCPNAKDSLPQDHEPPKLDDVLAGLITLGEFILDICFMQMLAACTVPKRLLATHDHLKIIKIAMDFQDMKQVLAALCLLRSSPSLQDMEFISCPNIDLLLDEDFWEAQQHPEDIILPKLKTVCLKKFKGRQSELGFVQFILVNSVVLETLNVKWEPTVRAGLQRAKVLEEMMQFQRASRRAKVIFSG